LTDMKTAIKALSKAQGEMDHAKKDEKGAFGKYATLRSVLDVLKPILSKHGFALSHRQGSDENGMYCDTMLMHESGGMFETRVHLINERRNMQGLGSAITYARRYGVSMLCNIATEDDDAEGTKPMANVNKRNIPNKIKKFKVHSTTSQKDFEDIDNAIMSLNSILSKQLEKYKGEERGKTGTAMRNKNAQLLEQIKQHDVNIYNQINSKLEKFNDQ